MIYRASDAPEVARWDTTTGREGYIVLGNAEGEVVLFARYPGSAAWTSILVENRFPTGE